MKSKCLRHYCFLPYFWVDKFEISCDDRLKHFFASICLLFPMSVTRLRSRMGHTYQVTEQRVAASTLRHLCFCLLPATAQVDTGPVKISQIGFDLMQPRSRRADARQVSAPLISTIQYDVSDRTSVVSANITASSAYQVR